MVKRTAILTPSTSAHFKHTFSLKLSLKMSMPRVIIVVFICTVCSIMVVWIQAMDLQNNDATHQGTFKQIDEEELVEISIYEYE